MQTVLSEGGVPQRPVVFVSRTQLVNRVRDNLYRLLNEPGWITVFGMAGSGKSVLAAEAVRDHGLIEGLINVNYLHNYFKSTHLNYRKKFESKVILNCFLVSLSSIFHCQFISYWSWPLADCFPGGIHWLSIGQVDKPDLLVKIQSLCFRLEQSLDSQSLHWPPNSLDEAKERLRFLMLRKYPK